MVIRNCDLTQVHRITNGFLHSGIFCVMTTSLLNKSTYLQVLPEWNVLQNQSWVICTHIVLLVCSYTLQCADINVTQNTMCIRLTTERSYHHPQVTLIHGQNIATNTKFPQTLSPLLLPRAFLLPQSVKLIKIGHIQVTALQNKLQL